MNEPEASGSMYSAPCSVRFCHQPAAEESPITCQPLCSIHLQAEFSKIQKSESLVTKRIAQLKKYASPMGLMQQRLASDLQLLDDTFTDLRDTLDKCQTELVDAITKQHDQMNESLRILSELVDFEKELRAAKSQNDARQAFLINESMEKSLESLQLDSNLVRIDADTQEAKMVAYPDVNAQVRDVKFCAQAQLNLLRIALLSLDATNGQQQAGHEVKSTENVIITRDKPICMAVCSNTGGFLLDASDRVVKAAQAPDGLELPSPSVFVAVESMQSLTPLESTTSEISDGESFSSTGGSVHREFRIHLLSTELRLSQRLSHSSWDVTQPISDLHCDNDRQLLFIAQHQAVTVADLSGVLHCRLGLRDDAQKLHCIAGDSDSLYVVATERERDTAVYVVLKESGEVQRRLPIGFWHEMNAEKAFIAVTDRILVICDGKKAQTLCSVTGVLLRSESTGEPTFSFWGVKTRDRLVRDSIFLSSFGSSSSGHPTIGLRSSLPLTVQSPLLDGRRLAVLETGPDHCTILKLKEGTLCESKWRLCFK